MTAAFEGWAIVELMGHRVRYARISEVTMFGAAFARLDIPSDPPTTQFYGGGAIYAITPTTEESVRAANDPRRLDRPSLTAHVPDADLVDDDEDDIWSPDDEDDLPNERSVDSDAPIGGS